VLIAFDGACLAMGPVTGVGRAFVTALAAYAARGDAECVLLLPPGTAADVPASVRVVPAPRGALRRQLELPRVLRALRADVLHSPVAAIPLRARCPAIATVHDLPWLHPQLCERTTAWRRLATRAALRRAAAVIAPSAATRDDVARLRCTRAPIWVVPHGTEPGPAPDEAGTRARSGPFLVLGDDRPRKNRERLRAAHALARAQDATLPELRFVGPPDAWVDEAHKHELLRTCRALVHVATFEGFGLPVLEGLAHGAPVVCSQLPPHVEIAGPNALYADALDPGAIASALVRVHRDDGLRWRLAAGGHARAAAFRPAATATAWARLHREAAR
jgi:glycosyltransferase involved in cell wall biosynthesis